MHLTGHELTLVPSAVAALAIIGGYFGVRSANYNARLLAKDQYRQDNCTNTYITMLKAVYFRAARLSLVGDAQPGQQTSQKPHTKLPSSEQGMEEEALFQAQLYAYASPKIYKQWVEFDMHTRKLEVQLIMAKAQSGPSASIRDFPELVSATTEWRRAEEELINLIRAELGIRRRRLRQASDEFRLPDWPAEN